MINFFVRLTISNVILIKLKKKTDMKGKLPPTSMKFFTARPDLGAKKRE